jgi:hypothetical protein
VNKRIGYLAPLCRDETMRLAAENARALWHRISREGRAAASAIGPAASELQQIALDFDCRIDRRAAPR